ncbi:unnamed protein product, partial [Staurois parvus]
MCHFQVSSHTAGVVPFCVRGCWQITGLPLAAARPVICHGPRTASSCCCQVQSVSWVPVRPPIAAVSIATLCHVPLSGLLTLLVVSIFCHRVLYGLPLLLPPPPHTVAPHSGFGPVTAQMSEVCGDSKIDGTHLHVIL